MTCMTDVREKKLHALVYQTTNSHFYLAYGGTVRYLLYSRSHNPLIWIVAVIVLIPHNFLHSVNCSQSSIQHIMALATNLCMTRE